MIFNKLLFVFTLLLVTATLAAQTSQMLSLQESLNLLQQDNVTLKIANQGVTIAEREHQKTASFWYPTISIDGSYAYFSNKIQYEQSLKPVQYVVENFLAEYGIDNPVINDLLALVGEQTLKLQLAPQQIATIDAVIKWPIFTGLKRLYGNKISKSMVSIAQQERAEVEGVVQNELVTTYFSLRLLNYVIDVKLQTVASLEEHLNNAQRFYANGLITKADLLLVQVNLEESRRDYQSSLDEWQVAQQALKNLLNSQQDSLILTTALFLCSTLPNKTYFQEQMLANSHLLEQFDIQAQIARNAKLTYAVSYAPEIALLGKQTLYAYGVDKNLVPRSMIGVGFSWTLFDGLLRESGLRQAKTSELTTSLSRDKAQNDLNLAIDKLYSQIEIASDQVSTLNNTLDWSSELVRMRRKSFAEGMATSTQVVDAELLYSKIQVARLVAYYSYDVALMSLCVVCGIPAEYFQFVISGSPVHEEQK